MYQRSADIFLGVPFNIASYALLTHILAHVTDCKAHELVMFFGDVHLYNNHMSQADTQIARYQDIHTFPEIVINADKTDIDTFVYDDFEVKGYRCGDGIKAPMAV
jgi:thymidylate synthase